MKYNILRDYYNSIRTKDMKSFDELTIKAKQSLLESVDYTDYKFISEYDDINKLLIKSLINYKNNLK